MVKLGLPPVLRDGQIDPAIPIKIRRRAPALLAVDFYPGFLASNGAETAFSISQQKQTSPAIVAGRFGVDVEEILRKKNVFVAIAVEIRHGQSESRRELSFDGQRDRFEMVAAIEKEHGIEGSRFEGATLGKSFAQQLFDTGFAERSISAEAFKNKRQRLGKGLEIGERDYFVHRAVEIGFNRVDGSVAVEIAVIEPEWLRAQMGLIPRVASPIGRDDIQPAIIVEIGRRNTIPEALESIQSELVRDFLEVTLVVLEDAKRAPVQGQNQLRQAVAVQIAEDGATNQADFVEQRTVSLIQH